MVVPVVPLSKSQGEGDELRSFVYNMGFLRAAWSDTVLSISNLPTLRLHALFISQSPVLYRHLSTQTANQGQYHINLTSQDPSLSAPAVSTALATLYGHPMDIQTCDYQTARGMLAAGCLLGIEKISLQAYDLLLKTLNKELLPTFLELAMSPSLIEDDSTQDQGPYPPYTSTLLAYLTEYIYDNFNPEKVDAAWTAVFTGMDYSLFKEIIESPKLKITDSKDRYTFAKNMVKKRKRSDEQVLLAFGNGTQGVQVVRRNKSATQRK